MPTSPVARASDAIRCTAGGGSNCAGNRKRAELDVIERVSLVIHNRPNHIGSVDALSRSAEVIFKVIVHLEWLTALEREATSKAPSIPQSARSLLRKLVAENPGEPVAHIKI